MAITIPDPCDRLFSVDDYYRMAEAGVIQPSERVELIKGKIVSMSPIGNRHALCVMRLTQWFVRNLEETGLAVDVQNPVRLNEWSEPEPDIAILEGPFERYEDRHPGPEDVRLIVEVSDTTLDYDQNKKLPLYAGAGIPEVWIVDLENRQLLRHSDLSNETYHSISIFKTGQAVSCGTIETISFPVDVLALS